MSRTRNENQDQDAAAGAAGGIDVPSASPFFAGHFPGAPVLPGAALLQLALQRIGGAELAASGVLALQRVRFQQRVLPGTRLLVATQAVAGGGVALRLHAASVADVVATATLAAAARVPAAAPGVRDRAATGGAVPLVLPHTGDAVLLRRVLMADATELQAVGTVPAASSYGAGAWASLALIEVAAQAAAAHGASAGRASAAAPGPAPAAGARPGMLVGIRHGHLDLRPRLDTELRVHVQRLGGSGPLTIYAARVSDVETVLMVGELSVWVQPGDSAS